MSISKLIELLEKARKVHGNLTCYILALGIETEPIEKVILRPGVSGHYITIEPE